MLIQTVAVCPRDYLSLGTNQKLHCSLAPGSLEQLGKDEKIGMQSPTLINQPNIKAIECFMVNEGGK